MNLLKLLAIENTKAASLARSIINSTKTAEEFQQILDLVEAIMVNKFPQLSTTEILRMLDLKNADVTQTRFYQEVFQIGEQEGLQKGRQSEAAALVILQLGRRCGVLSATQKKRIKGLKIEQLEILSGELLDFTSKEDLVSWLKVNG